MNTKSRIASILKANILDYSVTGFPCFSLTELSLAPDPDFPLLNDIRLGHLAENIFSELIKLSFNYKVIYENIQIIERKNTIGEIDFIIEDTIAKKIIHLELAYKFYLFDPSISSEPINNWVGPNRNDSLVEKLKKLKTKQFPLLHHPVTASRLRNINIDEASQALCFFVSLYVPYEFKDDLDPIYKRAIKGVYFNLETFIRLDNLYKSYYFPTKKEWGMDPAENKNWAGFKDVEGYMNTCMEEKQAPLCWQKHNGVYSRLFIVWW
ncbi:MAG: hypothetical protein ACI9O4_000820 [Chitinophagales bacterium]|jgi:hypothetical protein